MITCRSRRYVALTLLATLSAMSSGCSQNIAIRPDQIPRLSGLPGSSVVGQIGNRMLYSTPVATVLAPDGTNVQITGNYDLVLRLTDGQEFTFEYPVLSVLHPNGALDVNGANRPATRFNLGDVREAFATQPDGGLTFLALLGGLLLGVGLIVGAAIIVVS